MIRSAFMTFGVVLICCVTSAAQDDPIKARLAAAKQDFEKESTVAHNAIVQLFKDKKAEAQKVGDLQLLEKLQSEEAAFELNDELPKLISTRTYTDSIQKARKTLEDAYVSARKAYTQAGEIDDAKAIDNELQDFKSPKQGEMNVGKKTDKNMSIDLLKLTDPALDAVRGKWSRIGDSLISPNPYEDDGRISIPVWPSGDYDLVVKFTRLGGPNGPGVSLPVGTHRVNFAIDAYDGKFTSLQEVDGKYVLDSSNPTRVTGRHLVDNQQYTLRFRVSTKGEEPARIQVDLDGKQLIDWTGKPSRLSVDPNWSVGDHSLGLHAFGSGLRFDDVQLLVLSGEVKRPWEKAK